MGGTDSIKVQTPQSTYESKKNEIEKRHSVCLKTAQSTAETNIDTKASEIYARSAKAVEGISDEANRNSILQPFRTELNTALLDTFKQQAVDEKKCDAAKAQGLTELETPERITN